MFAFLYVKGNFKEIYDKIFPLFFTKMVMLAFLFRFKANYLEKIRGYHYSSGPYGDLLFRPGPNLVQKPLYSVGTVLS